MKWNDWIILGLGVWSMLSPWLLGFSDLNLVTWNSIFIGALLVVFILWNLTPPNK